jgi:isopentenyldiphosphate isomerase
MYEPSRFADRLENYTPADEIVLIVDRENRRTGGATRREMRQNKLIHRATFIFIQHPDNKLFVQKRTTTKDINPGYYDVCTGGVILESDESDEISALRELEEEMGIKTERLEFCFNHFYEDEKSIVWCAVFYTTWDREIVMQPEEVQWVELMSPSEIFGRAESEKFCSDGLEILRIMCETGKIIMDA